MSVRSRIYVAPEQVEGETLRLTKGDLHHVTTVLRLRGGDLFRATDGRGGEYLLRLAAGKEGPRAEILEAGRPRRESPLDITLVQAVPKGDLMTQIVQKAVELGVTSIVPVVTGRTVADPGADRLAAKGRRWRRVMEGAVAQCGRTRLPLLEEVQAWEDFVGKGPVGDGKIVLLEGESRGLGEVVGGMPPPSSLVLAVGPEGGWEEREIDLATRSGFITAGLGPRILRTETAGPSALSVLQFLFGDLGRAGSPPADSEKGREAL
jgi:16S rRNA (uracil1498-N3)-methyltransferase